MRTNDAASLALSIFVGVGVPLLASPAPTGPRVAKPGPAPTACLEHLRDMEVEAGSRCLRRVRESGHPSPADAGRLVDFLAGSDGATDHVLVASVLDTLRAVGRDAAPFAETLSSMLRHRSPLYTGRDKVLVVRLRAYTMVTLSEIGVPSSALPPLLDTLAHVDVRMTAIEVGAAARAAGALGVRGRAFAPYLLDTLIDRFGAEEFSLERFDPQFPRNEATTVHVEAVRALGRVCSPEDEQVLTVLRRLADGPDRDELDPRVRREAQRALEQIAGIERPSSARREQQ